MPPRMPHITGTPPVSISDVFKTYASAVREYLPSGALTLLGVVVGSIAMLFPPLFYKQFFDVLAAPDALGRVSELLRIIVIVFALNMVNWVGWRTAGFANAHFQPHVMTVLRERAFRYLLGHSYAFFAGSFTGALVQKVNRFARSFERLADRLLWNIIPIIIRVVGATIILSAVNPMLTLILLVWLVVFIGFNYAFSLWKLKYDIAGALADTRATAALADAVTNQNTIQLFAGEPREESRYREASRDMARLQRFRWSLDSIVDAVQSILFFAIEFALFYYAIKYWKNGLITIGVFVLVQTYLFDFVDRLWDFSRIVRDIYESFADSKEMVEILKRPHEIRDLPGAKPLSVPYGAINFEHVSFNFNETRMVLKDISLEVKPAEKVALIGPSGAGKSTFMRLLLRLYEPASGKILIDGQHIQHVTTESLRNQVALVPQDPLLFHRTLHENIRYGRPGATDVEVREAARLAHCEEFAKDLPQGYDTYVGERGIKLSGGERQRVAIARAILKNAPILVLDEATSSLDSHSESLIQDALEYLMKGKTVLVIAHRLSTIRKMDRIVVLEDGKIREEGTHDGLLATEDSLYAKLWNLQSGGFLKEEETEYSQNKKIIEEEEE